MPQVRKGTVRTLKDECNQKVGEYTSSMIKPIHKIIHTNSIIETGRKFGSVDRLLQIVTKAFSISVNGNLSDDIAYIESDVQNYEKCNLILEHLKVHFIQIFRLISIKQQRQFWIVTERDKVC